MCQPQPTQGKIGRGFGKNANEWTGRVEISKKEILGSKRSMYGCSAEKIRHKNLFSPSNKYCLFVSWCFEPGQPQRITSGLNTNLTLSPTYSFYKSFYNKLCFLSLFISRGHSTREPASKRATYFILRAYTGTSVSHSQHRNNRERFWEKMQVNGPEG